MTNQMPTVPNEPVTGEPGNVVSTPWPQYLNMVLAIWLFISAFVWPHTVASRTNTWILGVIVFLVALWALAQPQVRWLNTLAAIWLFFSSIWVQHVSVGTLWNNLIVAVLVFIFSLVPQTAMARTGTGRSRYGQV